MNIGIASLIEVDQVWPRINERIADACRRSGNDDWTAGELWTECRAGHAFLILVHDHGRIYSAQIWRFERKNGKPVFRCLMLWGERMKDWLGPVHEWINAIAKDNGAGWLVTTGRRGWLRLFNAAEWSGDMAIEVK